MHSIAAEAQAGGGALCLFEFIYLARPDSRLAGIEVHAARVRMGQRLADEAPAEADLVMPAPDSGTPAAIGYARATGIPYREGLMKNRYVGRTFIQPDQRIREPGISSSSTRSPKSTASGSSLSTTASCAGPPWREMVATSFEAGAQEVHMRVDYPPIISPCFLGVDLADEEQIAASTRRSKRSANTSAPRASLTSASTERRKRLSGRSRSSAAPASRAATRRASRPAVGSQRCGSSPRRPRRGPVR